uniref:TIL domain-containing protein n=1 Tax=Sinocyclocheilus grahami TaxID=75366 RepID=A0A672QI69_SINGR
MWWTPCLSSRVVCLICAVIRDCTLECPLNSHYSICVSSCPETCLGINGPPGCSEKCVEGCECDSDCGCVDSSGSYHPC